MSQHKMKLFIATSNAGKLRELLLLVESDSRLRELVEPVTPNQVGIEIEFEEHGESYIEVAKHKALQAAKVSGMVSLAEDSGLEVDALSGFPGSRSARFMGKGTSYDLKNQAILEMLSSVPIEKRSARYKCAMALATPEGLVDVVEEEVEGLIAFEAVGEGGFGYDPIFYLPGLGFMMAQLPIIVKNAISHRGKAFRRIAHAIKMVAARI
ncbi:MAG: non-canonical purine NTP pyrophosphatase [Armatimonadota bacterium]|nr:non-canonical purine NTP pyrophosphatase [Armatimonadota bacterium]MCX7777129.1 non-canonical purine NTP pyrophosphatase [Armatimonadota bacterium]MDW8025176.1 non-canonical purine NTP pyrophosphatase [Armatimonadota bacterium]